MSTLKRKNTKIGRSGEPAVKKNKPLSKAEVSSDDDEAPVVAPAAAAAAAAAAPKASSLAEGIKMLNKAEAAKANGKVRSLWADAQRGPTVALEATPIANDPYVSMVIDGKNVLPLPAKGKQAEVLFDVPAFPVGFIDLDPIRAVVMNNRPDAQYPKANAADVVATVNVDLEQLVSDPTYESSRPGVELLCHFCADAVVKPSAAMVFPDDHIEQFRHKAVDGDEDARTQFIRAGLVDANNARRPPYLPCKATKTGAAGTLEDVLKSGDDRGAKFKMTTKYFTYAGKELEGTGAHAPSVELARKLGGDDVEEVVKVLEEPKNHGRQLKLVPIYDEHNQLVPTEKYRQTVSELRGGAVTARIAVRIGSKNLGPKDRTVHVAAYINRLMIVKRGEVQEAPAEGGGIAAFLG